MPELPDVELYLRAMAARIEGEPLLRVRLRSPFLVRSVAPPRSAAEGRRVARLRGWASGSCGRWRAGCSWSST